MGIRTLRALIPPLFAHKMHKILNAKMKLAGERTFTEETLLAMHRSVLFEHDVFKDVLHWVVPEWRASELDSVEEKLRIISVHNVQSFHKLIKCDAYDNKWINSQLSGFGMIEFRPSTLHALRTRAQRVADLIQLEVNLHTLAGGLLVTLCVKASTTGADLMVAVTPYLEPDARSSGSLRSEPLGSPRPSENLTWRRVQVCG